MSLRVGESGKVIRVSTGFDMSSYTELTLTFIKPDLTTVTKTQTGGKVTLGTGIADPELGTLVADTYVEYVVEAGFLDSAGTWKVYVTYTDDTAEPDNIYIGDCATFPVTSVCS